MKTPTIPKKQFNRLGHQRQDKTYKSIKQALDSLNSLEGYSKEWVKTPKKELEDVLEELLVLKLES